MDLKKAIDSAMGVLNSTGGDERAAAALAKEERQATAYKQAAEELPQPDPTMWEQAKSQMAMARNQMDLVREEFDKEDGAWTHVRVYVEY